MKSAREIFARRNQTKPLEVKMDQNKDERVCDVCHGSNPWGAQIHAKLKSGGFIKSCSGCIGTERYKVRKLELENREVSKND